jgi:hypothetical protein
MDNEARASGSALHRACGGVIKAVDAVNVWLDKPITEGWFLEGFIVAAIALCGFALDEETFSTGVAVVAFLVFYALLKNIAIDLDDLRNTRRERGGSPANRVAIFAPRDEPGEGVLLGKTLAGYDARLSDSARESHVYVCGATRSGKSTLVANMVLQDIAAGQGVLLLDPHGDLMQDVLARVPSAAAERVVALDLADPDFAPGLNVFDVRANDPQMAKALVCGELLRIFKCELYPDVPEGFGPMFETYFRNAIMLVLESEDATVATLADVPRVFQDSSYRRFLVEHCPNQYVKDFWNKTAERVTEREIEIENVAPYVTSKFEPFLGSRAIRTIVGQQLTTLDFGAFMNNGHAVLISLPKGELGTNESRVLGLLLLQQIQIACMSRVRIPRSERRPVTLYVDEAQSFIGGAFTELLAESGKFGLRIVAASQTLSMLSSRTSQSLLDLVLSNVANVLALRVGVRDAELFAPWFRPHIAIDELIAMPNFRAAGRIMEGAQPGTPILIDLQPLPPAADPSVANTIVSTARSSYCRRRGEVESRLYARQAVEFSEFVGHAACSRRLH